MMYYFQYFFADRQKLSENFTEQPSEYINSIDLGLEFHNVLYEDVLVFDCKEVEL